MAEENKIEVGEEQHDDEAALVFQCMNCRGVIGDTTAWVCANNNLRTVTLSKITENVVQGKSLVTSGEDADVGSTYRRLRCGLCKEELGKVYQTTPQHLDSIRNQYTFDVSSLSSYQIGSMSVSSDVDADFLDIPTAKFLSCQLRKAQSLIVTLNDRLAALEQCFEADVNANTENENLSPNSRGHSYKNGESLNSPSTKKNKASSELMRAILKRKKVE